jgi:hypothetical protein
MFTFVALGLRMPAFSSPEKAYAARDKLAYETQGLAKPFADAQLFPIHGAALTNDVLDANFGRLSNAERDFVVPLDPDLDDLHFLWTLQFTFESAEHDEAFEAALEKVYGTRDLVEHAARFARDHSGFEHELMELHSLALRRLQHAPPEGAHLLESWKREEQALFAILDRIHELRREDRAAVLEEPEE